MEEEHRNRIQKAYSKLVQDSDIDLLLPSLIQKNVFSSEMGVKYMNIAEDHLSRKRSLFLDIQQRGPCAFSNLVASLCETGQNNLANLLEPDNNNTKVISIVPKERRQAHPFILPASENTENLQKIVNNTPYCTRVNLSNEPIKIQVEAATRFYDNPMESDIDVYSTHSRNRGIVLIINNIKYNHDVQPQRHGAEVDGKNLRELFCQMGFKIESHDNKTGEQMEGIIHNFKFSPKIVGVDMVFIILMGHGHLKHDITYITGIDNKPVSTAWVEEQFDNVHCKALQKRPKIIMYQTCRGYSPDLGVAAHKIVETDSAAFQAVLRTREDMLIAHSTLPGYASHRDVFLGTWYISVFCEIMMTHACTKHIEEIFKMVDSQLAQLRSAHKTMQTSMFINLGFKNCYIHPNIYIEDGVVKNIHDV